MLSSYPIRVKLLATFSVLLLLILILAGNALYTTYSNRDLVKYLSWRSEELPVAADLSLKVGRLRMTVSELRGIRSLRFPGVSSQAWLIRSQIPDQLADVEDTLIQYRYLLDRNASDANQPDVDPPDSGSPDTQIVDHTDTEPMVKIDIILERIHLAIRDLSREQSEWDDDECINRLDDALADLQAWAQKLPGDLYLKLGNLASELKNRRRAQTVLTIVTIITAGLLLWAFLGLFYRWIFQPLRVLIDGSRHIASGRFDYRIHMATQDEMAELADALNNMTERFQDIRDDLDRQVRERTKQAVRSEQLASVGFLAAGVSHEINNPLASIAMCAESLEGRIAKLGRTDPHDRSVLPFGHDLDVDDESDDSLTHEDREVMQRYLRMIQEEAFRCKGITEKLLDFSRRGPSSRQRVDLSELIHNVVELTRHLGKNQNKRIEFEPPGRIMASVTPQEIKQTILNLLTNALDSLDDGGQVRIVLSQQDEGARIEIVDNGCGMTPEVLEHLFEPFFTQRRNGQGTGLGLSITHRIISDHGGQIEAESAGPGKGSTLRILLPNDEQIKTQAA